MEKAHLFALYDPFSNTYLDYTAIADPGIVHRVRTVLRLKIGEVFILFNRREHMYVELMEVRKKEINIRIVTRNTNVILTPVITLLLPLLKKEALAEAVYAAVEVGVNHIQLVQMSKTRNFISESEQIRLNRIVIAAAEQSKQFSVPEINSPVSLNAVLQWCGESHRLFADPLGDPLFLVLNSIKEDQMLLLMVGPEGDLTVTEKDMLGKKGFSFCSLTPTVLRSSQAASLLVGACRIYERT